MDTTETLTAGDSTGTSKSEGVSRSNSRRCPGCDAPGGGPPPSATALFGGQPIHRCLHCGGRYLAGSEKIRDCPECCQPFVSEESPICAHCRQSGGPDVGSSDVLPGIAGELRRALAAEMRLIRHASLDAYLSRLAGALAFASGGDPIEIRVFEDERPRCIALPGGTLLISRGELTRTQYESELAFVIARECHHLESGDVARRLAGAGAEIAIARDGTTGWGAAAFDLMRIGCGADREYAADQAALQRLTQMGYDTEGPLRYLSRTAAAVREGDPRFADLNCALPPAELRARRLSRDVRASGRAPGRTNREPFRRAVSPRIFAEAERTDGGILQVDAPRDSPRRGPWFWLSLLAAGTLTLVLVLGLLFL